MVHTTSVYCRLFTKQIFSKLKWKEQIHSRRRSIDLQSGGEQKQLWSAGGGSGGSSFAKIARAVPKAESHEDASVGAQKFRVKLEPGPTDVLCQVLDSTIWCKTSVDVDAERIRLKSNS